MNNYKAIPIYYHADGGEVLRELGIETKEYEIKDGYFEKPSFIVPYKFQGENASEFCVDGQTFISPLLPYEIISLFSNHEN